MKTMSHEAMSQIDGGGFWSQFTCGTALATAALSFAAISGASGGLAVPLAFAVSYSIAVPACGVALLS